MGATAWRLLGNGSMLQLRLPPPPPCIHLWTVLPWHNFGDALGPPIVRAAASLLRTNGASPCIAEVQREKLDLPWGSQKIAALNTDTVVVGLGSVLQALAECVGEATLQGCNTTRLRFHVLQTLPLESGGPPLLDAPRRLVLWGSGLLGPTRPRSLRQLRQLGRAAHSLQFDIRAVRGPLTHGFLRLNGLVADDHAHGQLHQPPVYGDPALLLPVVHAGCHRQCTPQHERCFVPHRNDEPFVNASYLRTAFDASMRTVATPYAEMLEWILTCRLVVSSSLHGVIFAEAFGVPARWLSLPTRRSRLPGMRPTKLGHGSALSEGWLKYYDYYLATRPELRSDVIIGKLSSQNSVWPWPSASILGKYGPATTLRKAFALGGAPGIDDRRPFDVGALLHAFPDATRSAMAQTSRLTR